MEASRILTGNLDRTANLIKGIKNVGVDQCSRNIRKFNLNEYINETIMTLGPKLKKTNHHIHINCPQGIEVTTSPGAIAQIITNLVINSLKHGFDKSHNGRIGIDIKNKVDTILLVYTDDGKGIKPEDMKRIFDPYFTTKRNEGSSGLGMHIINNLVTEDLKGTIQLNSSCKRGVEFTIEFPSDLPK